MIIDDPLTEDRWLQAHSLDDAAWMIRCIWRDIQSHSQRKGQLLACACARAIWHLLADERSRHGVEVAERYLEGKSCPTEVEAAAEDAFQASRDAERYSPSFWASMVAGIAARPREDRFNDWKIPNAMRHLDLTHPEWIAMLVRDIFDNPFHPKAIHPAWLAVNDSVVQLAEAIYAGLAFDQLPTLGDVLEKSGCDDTDIVSHCREPGPHVRGCWVVDLILSKDR
jgi:hypothetical protein